MIMGTSSLVIPRQPQFALCEVAPYINKLVNEEFQSTIKSENTLLDIDKFIEYELNAYISRLRTEGHISSDFAIQLFEFFTTNMTTTYW